MKVRPPDRCQIGYACTAKATTTAKVHGQSLPSCAACAAEVKRKVGR